MGEKPLWGGGKDLLGGAHDWHILPDAVLQPGVFHFPQTKVLARIDQADIPRKLCLLIASSGPKQLSHNLEGGVSVVTTIGASMSNERQGSPR